MASSIPPVTLAAMRLYEERTPFELKLPAAPPTSGSADQIDIPYDHYVIERSGQPRALFVLPWLDGGGAENAALDLARGLTSQGWRIDVATSDPSTNRHLGDALSFAGTVWAADDLVPEGMQSEWIARCGARGAYDLVHVSNSRPGFDALPSVAKAAKRPLIAVHLHAEEEMGRGYPVYCAARCGRVADLFVVHSRVMEATVTSYGVDASKVLVLPVPRESGAIAERSSEVVRHPPRAPRLLYAGRMEPEKNPIAAIEAVRTLRDQNVEATLTLAGSGSLLQDVQRHLAATNSSAFILPVGHMVNMADVYAEHDVVVLPSHREGTPLVVIEAFAAGLPVVATDVGAVHECVHGALGVVIAANSPEALAQGIGTVLQDTRYWRKEACDDRRRVAEAHLPGAVGRFYDSALRRLSASETP